MQATPNVMKGYSASNGIPKPFNQGSIPQSVIGGAVRSLSPGIPAMSSGMSAGAAAGYKTPGSYPGSYPSSPGPKAATYGYSPTPQPLSAQAASGNTPQALTVKGSYPDIKPQSNGAGSGYSTGYTGSITDPNKKELIPGYTGPDANRPISLAGTGGNNFAQAAQAANPDAARQQGVQNWIDNPKSGFGGVAAYTKVAQDRYSQAMASGDYATARNIIADSARVGFSLTGSGATVSTDATPPVDQPPAQPQPTIEDYMKMARAELEPQFTSFQNSSNQQIEGINSQFANDNRITQDNRTLENLSFQRNHSPFTGQTDYAQGVMERERTLADANAMQQHNSQIGGIKQGVTDRQGSLEQAVAARAYQMSQDAQTKALQASVATGNYLGKPTVAAKTLAFNQGLETSKFNHTVSQDEITNKLNDSKFNLDMAKFADDHGIKWATLDMNTKKALAQVAIEQQNANTSSRNADTSSRNADTSRMNADTSRMNAGTSAASAANSISNSKVDQLFKVWQDTGVAPTGIPGVKAGTPIYDKTATAKDLANLYKVWQDTGVAPDGIPGVTKGTVLYNKSDSGKQQLNSKLGGYASQLDALNLSPAELKKALQGEKAQIIKETSLSDYTKLYNSYFDQFGNLK